MCFRSWILLITTSMIMGCSHSQALRPPSQISAIGKVKYPKIQSQGDIVPATKVDGQAFLRQRGGAVISAAGSTVFLVPRNDAGAQWLQFVAIGQGSAEFSLADIPLPESSKTTTADASGRFEFIGIVPGDYYLLTTVTWETGYTSEGGWVGQSVAVPATGISNLILNRNFPLQTLVNFVHADSAGFWWESCESISKKAIQSLAVPGSSPHILVGARPKGEPNVIECKSSGYWPFWSVLMGMATLGSIGQMLSPDSSASVDPTTLGVSIAGFAFATFYPSAKKVQLRQIVPVEQSN